MDQSDPIGQTDTVSVGYDCRFAEYIPHDQVGAFSSYPGKLQQGIEIFRYFVVVLFMENLHTSIDIPGLAFSQTTGAYNFFNFLRGCRCQGSYIRISGVQILYHYIYPGICTLCSQPYAYQQFPCIIIIQGAICIRIFFF